MNSDSISCNFLPVVRKIFYGWNAEDLVNSPNFIDSIALIHQPF